MVSYSLSTPVFTAINCALHSAIQYSLHISLSVTINGDNVSLNVHCFYLICVNQCIDETFEKLPPNLYTTDLEMMFIMMMMVIETLATNGYVFIILYVG